MTEQSVFKVTNEGTINGLYKDSLKLQDLKGTQRIKRATEIDFKTETQDFAVRVLDADHKGYIGLGFPTKASAVEFEVAFWNKCLVESVNPKGSVSEILPILETLKTGFEFTTEITNS